MKIIFIVSSMSAGGAERNAANLCNHWVSKGHQVILIPTFSGRGECHYSIDSRVSLKYLADRLGTTHQSFLNKMHRLWILRTIIFKSRPDVVISFLSQVNVATVLAVMGLDIPIIVSERTYPPLYPLGRTFELLRRWTYPKTSAVVMQTEKGLKWLKSNLPNTKGFTIPNPLIFPLPNSEPKRLPSKLISSDTQIILAVGRLDLQKGFERLINAFSSLANHHKQWDLVILGEGPSRSRLEIQCENLNVKKRVHLPGRVGNLSDWYKRAAIFVLSSHFEGFPNVLLEAMAHGLAVVSVDCPTGPKDLINEGENGLLVPEVDVEIGLEKALKKLMVSKNRRKEMGIKAKSIINRFSIDVISEKWDRVLNFVVNRKRV